MNPILLETAHRPYAMPTQAWVMAQQWHDLLFIHYPINADLLRPYIPTGLTLETFEGQAWLGIVPFRMVRVHPRWTPSVPYLSYFPELNVRTYVTDGTKQGVWFFSLDAGNPIAVRIAQRGFHLPYFDADMTCQTEGETIRYRSHRTHKNAPMADFSASYRPTSDTYHAIQGTLEHWLTERYCLYTVDGTGRLVRGEIQHAQWTLQSAEADIKMNTMTVPLGIALPDVPPLLHFVKKLEVVNWLLAPVK